MSESQWPTDVQTRRITPSNSGESFTISGSTYIKTGLQGLRQKGTDYAIVPLYKRRGPGQTTFGTSYYYDTGKTTIKHPEGLMSIYPKTYVALSFDKYSVWRTANIAGTNRNSVHLTTYYASLSRGSNLLRTNAQVNKAMQRIKDAFAYELSKSSSSSNPTSFFTRDLEILLRRAKFSESQIKLFMTGKLIARTIKPSPRDDTGTQTPGGSIGEQRIVVRAPFGYIQPTAQTEERPSLIQYYPLAENLLPISSPAPSTATQNYAIEKFVFPYIPNNIQYQGSGSEWVEIPRSGDFPIVEWSRWQLLKISMEFLIANNRIEDQQSGRSVPDGIFFSVHEQIETLRRMSQRPYPISVLNLDHFFKIGLRRAQTTGKPLEFVISDFSFSATRRSRSSDVTQDSEITAATCRLTLQEIPIESTSVVKFDLPILAPKKTPKKGSPDKAPNPTDGPNPIYDLVSSGISLGGNTAKEMPTTVTGRTAVAQSTK